MTSIGRGVARAGVGLLASLGAMAVMVGTLAGQESRLVGTWDVTGRLEDMPPEIAMTWTFESQDDGTVTGTWTGEAEGESYSQSADEIRVDGDAFGFTVSVVDQGQTGVFTFEGALSEDEVSGTFHVHAEGMPETLVGTFSGSRAEGTDAAPSW
ncbi:hypothetical protein [Candidatus Palauibacter sp.]|uniref:hypothetical protein n=1 Tax=Candidatus Palauibacter sp. TaxID=3101350 RepID=UPI003B02667D